MKLATRSLRAQSRTVFHNFQLPKLSKFVSSTRLNGYTRAENPIRIRGVIVLRIFRIGNFFGIAALTFLIFAIETFSQKFLYIIRK